MPASIKGTEMSLSKRVLLAGMISVTALGLLPGSAQAANVVKAKNNMTFAPDSITIQVGERVEWRNPSKRAHTVTSTSGSPYGRGANWLKDSKLNPGGSTRFAFEQAGTYNYRCMVHSNMTGQVSVI